MKIKKIAFSIFFIASFIFSACGGAPSVKEVPAEEASREEYVAPAEEAVAEAPSTDYSAEAESLGQTAEGSAPSSTNSNQPQNKSDDEPTDMFFEDYGTIPS